MRQHSKIVHPHRLQSTRAQCADQWCIPPPRRRTVVVYLDGRSSAEHALPYAMTFAGSAGSDSRIVLVASSLLPNRLGTAEAARDYLRAIAGNIRARTESHITTVEIDSRDMARSLRVAATDASLVVMASQSRGLLERTLRGDVTNQLLRQLPCPLLLIPDDGAQVDLAWRPTLKNVVIPLDGSPYAERAVDAVAAAGLTCDAQFTLTHVQDVDRLFGRSLGDARAYLSGAATRARNLLSQVNTVFSIGFQRVGPAILSLADQQPRDLIALTTQARSGLARIFKPSIAAQIVRHAEIPVLLCGPACRPTAQPVRAH